MGLFKKDFYFKIYNELKKLDVSSALKLKPNQRSTFAQAASQIILSSSSSSTTTTFQAPAAAGLPLPPSRSIVIPATRAAPRVPLPRKPIPPAKLKPGQGIRQGQTVIRVISKLIKKNNNLETMKNCIKYLTNYV